MKLFYCVFLAILIVPFVDAATFGCTIKTSCLSNETVLLRLNSSEAGDAPNNSHAQLANYTPQYPYSLCCWTDAFRTLNNSCTATSTRIIGLYTTTDSHVQIGTNVSYPQSVCLNVTQGTVVCEYPNSACSAGFNEVISMVSSEHADNTSNAHAGEFAKYLRKVCCGIGAQNPPYVLWTNISPNMTATTRMDLECQNGTVGDADSDSVTIHYNWYKNGTSVTVLNLPMDYDSNTGTTHDISGLGNHAVVAGATFLPTAGNPGGAFDFNTGNSLNLGNYAAAYGENYAWTAWIYPKGLGGVGSKKGVISKADFVTLNDGVILALGNGFFNSRLAVYSKDVVTYSATSTTELVINQWYFVVVTMNSTNVTIYLDGLYSGSGASNINLSSNSVDFFIGQNSTPGSGLTGFNGTIDEVMIFNRSLSASEILTLYNSNNRFINSTELRRTEGWNCSITPVDSTGLNGTTRFSNMTVITGSAPLASNLTYPVHNNQSVFERFVNFTWTNANERDGDQVNYTLNLTVTSGSGLCSVETTQTNILVTNYTFGELCVDQLYNWTVRACDIDGCVSSNKFNFTVASVVGIRLLNNNTNFGAMNTSQSKSTDVSGDGVTPFILENDGNVIVNVTFVGNNSPFSSVGLGDTAFKFKARSNESNAFNASGSQMTYVSVLSTYLTVLKQLNYSDSTDAAYIDINITVPVNEPPGYKVANATFSAVMSQ